MVTFGVLGPVRAETPLGPVPLKGPRHRAVLARLLVARGRVVPIDMLAADLWTDPPSGAVAAIRTFVADLRRALEPGRPARQPAHLLVTTPPGYALQTDAVDAWRFEAEVGSAGPLLAAGDAASALAALETGLARWQGPAYAEWAGESWARAEIDRLDGLRMLAIERRGEALLALGRAAEAVEDLRGHAVAQPLREDAWQLLARALYQAGRQGEALAALRRTRETLVAELGVDPGPGLRQLETDILLQAPHLTPPARPALPAPPAPGAGAKLVGRDGELSDLLRAAEAVTRPGRPVLVLVSAEAGGGKTALVETLAELLTATGWTTERERSPEYEGAPAAWPQLLETDPADDPAVARFRQRQAAMTKLTAVPGPVLLIADDLHRADEITLDLLSALLGEPWPALIVGTFRATEIGPALTAALARFARAEPVRIYLGGLTEADTGALVRTVAGQSVTAGTARVIHRRSGGNPFFARELARLLAAEGDAALARVPAGVRDVIRHRIAQLPETAQTVLRQASVLGRDLDPEVLADLSGTPLLDALDAALRAGFLTEDGPGGRPRFTHILVRDTLYGDLSALRRSHWHTVAAETLERRHPQDVAALAHHFSRAASRATAPRAARYSAQAAEQAERRSRPHEAARLWRQALAAHDLGVTPDEPDRPGAGERDRLAAVMGLGRVVAITGRLDEARRLRAEAIAAVQRLDDPELTADVIAGFVVPAVWTRNDDERLSAQIVAAAERALAALPDHRDAQRSRLLSTIALELRGTTTDRGDRAAREAETIARRVGHPGLLAFALNARFMHTFTRTGLAPERARIGAELVAVAAAAELVTFEVLGHLILVQAHSAPGDFPTADTHAHAADGLAERYDLPLVGVFTRWYAALRLAVDGHPAEAEVAYRAASAQAVNAGMPGMTEGLLALALLSLGADGWAAGDFGPDEPWVRPLILLAAGRREEAAQALSDVPESPHDLLWEARLSLVARAADTLGDRVVLTRVREELRPAAREVPGAGSGVFSLDAPIGAPARPS